MFFLEPPLVSLFFKEECVVVFFLPRLVFLTPKMQVLRASRTREPERKKDKRHTIPRGNRKRKRNPPKKTNVETPAGHHTPSRTSDATTPKQKGLPHADRCVELNQFDYPFVVLKDPSSRRELCGDKRMCHRLFVCFGSFFSGSHRPEMDVPTFFCFPMLLALSLQKRNTQEKPRSSSPSLGYCRYALVIGRVKRFSWEKVNTKREVFF